MESFGVTGCSGSGRWVGGRREAPAASSNKSAGERSGTLWTSPPATSPLYSWKHPDQVRKSQNSLSWWSAATCFLLSYKKPMCLNEYYGCVSKQQVHKLAHVFWSKAHFLQHGSPSRHRQRQCSSRYRKAVAEITQMANVKWQMREQKHKLSLIPRMRRPPTRIQHKIGCPLLTLITPGISYQKLYYICIYFFRKI